MAISANIEWKLEAAFLIVLAARADIIALGVPIRRFNDTSTAVTYPVIAVEALGAEDEPWAKLLDFTKTSVEITCYTYSRTDTTGSQITNLLGAVRDAVYDSSLLADLSGAVAGLTVYGVVNDYPTVIEDDDRRRIRTMVLSVHASAIDI